MTWEAVIGLEVHAQLKTKSKIFSESATQYGAEPNTQANAIDLGLPGVLPVLNKEVVKMAVKFGLAVNANINLKSIFARKNYFYPDLPKGYQITQFELPIVGKGILAVADPEGNVKKIGITRAHLEEDAGKSLHEDFHGMTGIDLNRAGTPLLEIVSEPDLRTAKEAVLYLKALHALVRYLDICDGNMQEGSFRCDANVSVHKIGEPFGTRVEIKNLNSFRFIERAIDYEIQRQIEEIEHGNKIVQETRLYNANTHKTKSMRSKEEANDYRYFPEPDLLPLVIDKAFIETIAEKLPELPEAKRQRFISQYGLSAYDAGNLISSQSLADYFEQTVKLSATDPKITANWIMGELSAALNKHDLTIEHSPVTTTMLAGLLKRIHDHTISGKIAKSVFEAMWAGEGDADTIISKQGLKQVTDSSALEKIVAEIIANSPEQLADYLAGKERLFSYFVGQTMKATKGQANPQQVNEILKQQLKRVTH
ncbi:MAG: aspartyl/glutamyl-tRNA amidotransferase subunit B [Gammaproteobacteria bacterium RIFCSPHIGHO2_12_FULL_35_23]|nr:MAG: aspartyl/glutamyl-tRNA amidotransferase subunit B [Gammaproteobacteria bacterium RIFCSPHIGHO2_12_FULL_35_23]